MLTKKALVTMLAMFEPDLELRPNGLGNIDLIRNGERFGFIDAAGAIVFDSGETEKPYGLQPSLDMAQLKQLCGRIPMGFRLLVGCALLDDVRRAEVLDEIVVRIDDKSVANVSLVNGNLCSRFEITHAAVGHSDDPIGMASDLLARATEEINRAFREQN